MRTKKNQTIFRIFSRDDVILSKTEIRVNNRRNSLNIRAMHEGIEKLEVEIRKKDLIRTNEKKHIEKIMYEWKMQMKGLSTKIYYIDAGLFFPKATQYAHNVVLTSKRRRFNVMDVV